jgi:hypothetical protein
MARNGSGTHTVPNSFTPSTTISSSAVNANFTDISAEITNSVAVDGQSTMTGTLKAANGAVALPAITFGSDPDSGMYRIGANNIGISVNETKILDIATTGLSVVGTLTPSGVIVASAGTNSAPGYSFASDLNTGMYQIGADNIGLTAGGTKIVDVATTGIAVTGTFSATGTIAGGTTTITSTSASALTVGRQGATDPVLKVNAATGSVATGISITGAAATGGVAVAAISSGTDEALTINAKGSGAIGIGSVSTGAVTITPALTANASAGVTARNTAKAFGYATYSAGTPTLQTGSFNIASITDSDTGYIRFTFTNAMANATYVAVPDLVDTDLNRKVQVVAKNTAYVELKVSNVSNNEVDPIGIGVAVFTVS